MQRVGEVFGKKVLDVFSDSLVPRQRENFFECRVQASDGAIEIDRHQAHVDRFDDRLVEFFENLEFGSPALLLLIEQAVFNCD